MRKNILITGGNGFIGSLLADSLSRNGNYKVAVSVRKLSIKVAPNIDVHSDLEVNSSKGWEKALKGVDTVIHCAARYHINGESQEQLLISCRNVNVDGTMQLADIAARSGVKRFIFISSIKVNGEYSYPQKPFNENDKPKPQYPYGISKLEAEESLKLLAKKSNMELVIVRAPPVYGPGVKENFLMMLNLINSGMPLPLRNINNLRSYVSIENLISFVKCAIEHPKAANEIFLVSDDHDLSIADLVDEITKNLNKKNRTFKFPVIALSMLLRVIGKEVIVDLLIKNSQADIGKAKHLLGWKPEHSVEEGIKSFTKDYLNRKKA